MAASLRDLLSQEIAHRRHHKPRPPPPSSDCRSFDHASAAAPEAADRAVVSVLVGYVDRYLKDAAFRRRLREKCAACVAAAGKGAVPQRALANLELGIETIERLVGAPPHDAKIRSLRSSIRLLRVVASPNSLRSSAVDAHLSACARLYLAVVCKIKRDDRASAKHLLQVFVDAPYLARKSLLPDLWDHFLLPNLLHLNVWYKKEVELISSSDAKDREQKMKSLNRAYNDQMNAGTAQLAAYYRDWIKVGGKAPPTPTVPLPTRPSYFELWGKTSLSSSQSLSSANLYQAVFGLSLKSKDTGDNLQINDNKVVFEKELDKDRNLPHSDVEICQREANTAQEHPVSHQAASAVACRSNSFQLLTCRSMQNIFPVHHPQAPKPDVAPSRRKPVTKRPQTNLSRAIQLISESHNLKECEIAVRTIAKARHDADAAVVTAWSTESVIEGLLEVMFTSKDDEVLELLIGILAELVTRIDSNRQVVLQADPQLEIFLRLLRSRNLFLKAVVLVYLLKPKAKQMLSLDWIPLVLRVLNCGNQIQTLFAVQCCPRSAALYLLEQLLMGFDVDRNIENSKQLILVGGLDVLIRRFEIGNIEESRIYASLLARCIEADGSCREYLAVNLKKTPILQLLGAPQKSDVVIFLLSEMICLDRTTQMITFLKELKDDGFLNTMHILLIYLQQAPHEQRPIAAALLLQLDLLGDPLKCSIYREEAVDALTAALEHNLHSRKIQEKCCKALLILGRRYSCLGEAISEAWLLKKAGLHDSFSYSCSNKQIFVDEYVRQISLMISIEMPNEVIHYTEQEEEEQATEEWLRKLAIVLLGSGKRQFLTALSNGIANGIPSLARACLVTVAWMSISLASWHNANHLQSLVCSTLAPRLFESLSCHRAQEERVLASLSLFNFLRYPDCLPKLFPLDEETISSLQDLARVTWTAKELLFACCR